MGFQLSFLSICWSVRSFAYTVHLFYFSLFEVSVTYCFRICDFYYLFVYICSNSYTTDSTVLLESESWLVFVSPLGHSSVSGNSMRPKSFQLQLLFQVHWIYPKNKKERIYLLQHSWTHYFVLSLCLWTGWRDHNKRHYRIWTLGTCVLDHGYCSRTACSFLTFSLNCSSFLENTFTLALNHCSLSWFISETNQIPTTIWGLVMTLLGACSTNGAASFTSSPWRVRQCYQLQIL